MTDGMNQLIGSGEARSAKPATGRIGRKICLLTPYTGTNFGDGAIQQATIDNLRMRIPGVELCGITLSPRQMLDRHGIESVPIIGLDVRFYSESLSLGTPISLAGYSGGSAAAGSPSSSGSSAGFISTCWRIVKSIPLLGRLAVMTLRLLRQAANVLGELRSIWNAAAFLKDKDAVIASGGGQLDDEWGGAFGHPYAMFRWAVLCRIRKVEFIVLSVGVAKLRSRTSRWFIDKTLRLATYKSYRDSGSQALLQSLGIAHEGYVYPDLVFSLARPKPALVREHPVAVAVSLISFGRIGSWPTENERAYRNYLGSMVDLVRYLLAGGFKVTIVRSSGADADAIADIRPLLVEAGCELAPEAFPEMNRLEDYLSAVERCDLVVASRLHSVMLSHLAERPCLAISFDRKVSVHMSDFEQDEYCLDMLTFDFASLRATFEKLAGQHLSVARSIAGQVERRRGLLRAQYDNLFGTSTVDGGAAAGSAGGPEA